MNVSLLQINRLPPIIQFHILSESPNENLKCSYVHRIPNVDRCAWIRNTADCAEEGVCFMHYLPFMFCTLSSSATAAVIVMLIWLIALFIILGTIADIFFCPALTVVAKLLHLSQSMAGVTILAFGNGAPDIFTSYSSILVGKGELAYNELVGGGMFVTTVVISCICIFYPFRVVGSLFVRDVCCYMLGAVYTYVVFHSGHVGVGKTAGFVFLYMGYIVLVLLARYTHKKAQFKETLVEDKPTSQVSQERRRTPSGDDDQEEVPVAGEEPSLAGAFRSVEADQHIIHLSPSRVLNLLGQYPARISRDASTTSSIIGDLALQAERIMMLSLMDQHDLIAEERSHRLASFESIKRRPVGLWSTFLHEIKPFDLETWKHDLWITKVISIIKIPVISVFKFIVPVVNLTAINHGWCKLLNTLHCITMPLFSVFVLNYAHIQLFDKFSLWLLVLILGVCLAVVVFFTSKSYIPPRYHELFSIAGFIASVLAIKKVAGEVVCILHAVGIMLRITEGTLGLTVLAWGNSLGDLIANVAIAKAGFQRMGFAACFGGPMFKQIRYLVWEHRSLLS